MSRESGQRRDYHSPLRDRRALETRRLILDSALKLILDRGYAATTMRDIAAEAGVAVQTIYSSIGSKRELLSAFIDQMEADARLDLARREITTARHPRDQLRLRASWSRRIFEAGIDIIEMMIRSQGTAPEISEILEEGDGRHRASVKEWIVDNWDDAAIRKGLARTEAVDIIATTSGVDVYRWLVRRYGWTPDAYEAWLAHSLIDLVLSDEYRP